MIATFFHRVQDSALRSVCIAVLAATGLASAPAHASAHAPAQTLPGPVTQAAATTVPDRYAAQRELFKQASKALQRGRITRFKALSDQLQDYPLYAYLRYDYLRKTLHRRTKQELQSFLHDYASLPVSPLLRNRWLKRLARRGDWQTFVDVYDSLPRARLPGTRLQCLQLTARLETGKLGGIEEAIEKLWLVGKSQPAECDRAFRYLYDSDAMNDELIWQRIRLAMKQGQTHLAIHLAGRLPADEQKWVARWQQAHWNPKWHLRHTRYDDNSHAREIYTHLALRVARRDPKLANELWQRLKPRYAFSDEQLYRVQREIAVRAARKKLPEALAWLTAIDDDEHTDEQLQTWRVRAALEAQDWKAVAYWIQHLSPEEKQSSKWQYWLARASDQIGHHKQAGDIYARLAKQRDFYGFLAADYTGNRYQMNDQPTVNNLQQREAFLKTGGILRAIELYRVGRMVDARREWAHAIRDMDDQQIATASLLASHLGWHDRAILTIARSRAFDDLALRFPLAYREQIQEQAERQHIDVSWTYGIIRQESIFMADARSPKGALGLMQLMPSTGRHVARKLGLPKPRKQDILEAERNLLLGTSYLQQMLKRYAGNRVLATAAYNAGPLRVDSWLPESEPISADLWIEAIPYTETRRYVRRVMAYAAIFDWRLQREIEPVCKRLQTVLPKNSTTATGGADSCTRG